MADPVTTITASAIASLGFQKFLESGAGELAKKFTTEAIAKMDILLKRIWSKLSGKPRIEEVKTALDKTAKIGNALLRLCLLRLAAEPHSRNAQAEPSGLSRLNL
ncbi:hypothetical protein IQ254_02815 [Nodosilinea sp. LEGE 07088]|uniref:hypothetical protein n=1 Tax=Nodosilinea sp. LEGE 07088 TaxID=2777968 RepID=UPI001880553E|nr:hypothetical protein [Nodosilinea sp. LEGE 07088]MBE9136141.1 hypothetical protein [Nodosilinea sp. LEGE 07088]